MKYAPATHRTASAVLRRYADWLDQQPVELRKAVADDINAHLDELLGYDTFGTEGQQDPRGDHRR